eukprot:15463936-Alexandrium_andersonii.AAC.1
MHDGFGRSEPELRGPGKDLEIDTRSSRGLRSVPFFALIPDLTSKRAVREVPRDFEGELQGNTHGQCFGLGVHDPAYS